MRDTNAEPSINGFVFLSVPRFRLLSFGVDKPAREGKKKDGKEGRWQ